MTTPNPALAFLPPDRISWFVGIEDTCVLPRETDDFPPLDEHALTGHNTHLSADLASVANMGVHGLRYGMSWPLVHVARDRYDWSLLDPAIEQLHAQGTHVIADLVHYGCPPWLAGSFVDDEFVDALTSFAGELLQRYGDTIGSITPINEPTTTASFCGLRSVWPPALGTWEGWASVVVSLAAANQAVTRVVRELSPSTAIVHVEASHHYEATDSELHVEATRLGDLADLSTDLMLGHVNGDHPLWAWLRERGVSEGRLEDLRTGATSPDVLGVNYYPDLTPRVLVRSGSETEQMAINRWSAGLGTVLRRTSERYKLPILITETSIEGSEHQRVAWLDSAVAELERLRTEGLDIRGITWWPLIDFIDWSVSADGRSVEEFVAGVVDPVTKELAPVPLADRNDGLQAFARRMGLYALEEDDQGALQRRSTRVADRFAELAAPTDDDSDRHQVMAAGRDFDSPVPSISLDGEWELETGSGSFGIQVPGLWEAQTHTTLDGVAVYRRCFVLDEPEGFWTLRFGAVMDIASVTLNGSRFDPHENPYTPFEVDATGLLVTHNELVVEVTDPPEGSDTHLASAHGKQGWANHEFPSPPSMYLTYGGIWQSVRLRRHDRVAIRDLACDLDPTCATVTVELEHLVDHRGGLRTNDVIEVAVSIGGRAQTVEVELNPGERRELQIELDTDGLDRWSPSSPVLHLCSASVTIGGHASDDARIDIGLRVVELTKSGLRINGDAIQMKSALVQGFHADLLYAEGPVPDIETEVRTALELGFNTLRLHLRPFAPAYLEVCDRLGMLLHCDVSIGEPIQHDQIDAHGEIAHRCEEALVAHVRRDRSHPSIVMWSCMNEIGIDRPSLRGTERYERFVRRMVRALRRFDETRPFIENDWIEPDPDRVFESRALTAHWYGRLDRFYLNTLSARCAAASELDKPLFVTEFGDWGLPDPSSGRGHFYAHEDHYESELARTAWAGTLTEFSTATQAYQGISGRLQIDTMRASGSLAGYCITELTDVPWEFNGILDINRNAKPDAARQITLANRSLSPILQLSSFAGVRGTKVLAQAWVANDDSEARHLDLIITLGTETYELGDRVVGPHSVADFGIVEVALDANVGESFVQLDARDRGSEETTTSKYPIVVHGQGQRTPRNVDFLGAAELVAKLREALGLEENADQLRELLVVAEDCLGVAEAAAVRAHVDRGGTALLLAQPPSRAHLYPFTADIIPIRADWGGTPFRYTTGESVISGYPLHSVLHVHDADIAPDAVVTVPNEAKVAVGVYKPLPRPAAGAVVASVPVGAGTVVVCQYRLLEALANGSAAATPVLADILTWSVRQKHAPTPERRMPQGEKT